MKWTQFITDGKTMTIQRDGTLMVNFFRNILLINFFIDIRILL